MWSLKGAPFETKAQRPWVPPGLPGEGTPKDQGAEGALAAEVARGVLVS